MYLSPEQLRLGIYGKEVDIWSLGIIAYELFFNKTPFDNDIVSIVNKMNPEKELFELRFSKPISSNAQDFLTRILEKKPKKRLTVQEALEHPFIKNKEETKFSGSESI